MSSWRKQWSGWTRGSQCCIPYPRSGTGTGSSTVGKSREYAPSDQRYTDRYRMLDVFISKQKDFFGGRVYGTTEKLKVLRGWCLCFTKKRAQFVLFFVVFWVFWFALLSFFSPFLWMCAKQFYFFCNSFILTDNASLFVSMFAQFYMSTNA